jgi:hypothetical protein
MAISPFSFPPSSPEGERRRARLVLAIALVGIVATLLAYAISPGVRRDVTHAAHSVGHVLDRDKKGGKGEHGRAGKRAPSAKSVQR